VLHDRVEVKAAEAVLLHRFLRLVLYVLLERIERAPALDDALRVPLPHRVDVVVADRLRPDGRFEVERDEQRLDAGVGEFFTTSSSALPTHSRFQYFASAST